MSKNTRTRIILTAVAALLLVTMAVGGTLAWLKDNTESVINTFTTAGIDIDLFETLKPESSTPVAEFKTGWTAQLVPGKNYYKNPLVEVESTTSVDIFLFVKFEHTANMPALTYESKLSADAGWTNVVAASTDANGVTTEVWGRVVKVADTTKSWYLLNDVVTPGEADAYDNGSVKIADTVKGAQTAAGGELKWTAYAVQTTGFAADVANVTAAEYTAAWNVASTLDN